ncbi:hypothetical protein E4U59_004710 [Claviceps monticola]|nr:hypothetical protein E4U59_004710 [Claviceps monticola]
MAIQAYRGSGGPLPARQSAKSAKSANLAHCMNFPARSLRRQSEVPSRHRKPLQTSAKVKVKCQPRRQKNSPVMHVTEPQAVKPSPVTIRYTKHEDGTQDIPQASHPRSQPKGPQCRSRQPTYFNSSGVDTYQMYRDNGSPSEGWPEKSLWVPFENMFRNYRGQMLQSCGNQNPPQPNNDEEEVKAIYDGIQKASVASGVDRRFIPAILMQESKGCNHDGAGTCNEGGLVKKPCPEAAIHQMISVGVSGTAAGDGLANCMNVAAAGSADVSAFYKAARIYNSGSIAKTGQLQDGIATHCYASDVAK